MGHSKEVGIHSQCYRKVSDGFDQGHDMLMFGYPSR